MAYYCSYLANHTIILLQGVREFVRLIIDKWIWCFNQQVLNVHISLTRHLSKPFMLSRSKERSTGCQNDNFHRRSLFSSIVTVSATLRGRTLILPCLVHNVKCSVYLLYSFVSYCRPKKPRSDLSSILWNWGHYQGMIILNCGTLQTGCDDTLALTES